MSAASRTPAIYNVSFNHDIAWDNAKWLDQCVYKNHLLTFVTGDTGCDSDYDGNGICDSYFYDGTDTYSITDPQNMATDQDKIMQKLIGGESPLTTGKILFTSGLQCTQTCGSNGGCAPSLDSNDPSSASCISTARVCTWTWDEYGPFQPGCANLPSGDAVLPRFGVDPCVGHDESTSVPWSYLGGGIVDNNAPGWWADQVVCHTKY